MLYFHFDEIQASNSISLMKLRFLVGFLATTTRPPKTSVDSRTSVDPRTSQAPKTTDTEPTMTASSAASITSVHQAADGERTASIYTTIDVTPKTSLSPITKVHSTPKNDIETTAPMTSQASMTTAEVKATLKSIEITVPLTEHIMPMPGMTGKHPPETSARKISSSALNSCSSGTCIETCLHHPLVQ